MAADPDRAPSGPARSSQPLRPKWFISRGNGVLVPVIAVDELPPAVHIQGVPRRVGYGEVKHMECLGEFPSTNSHFILLQHHHQVQMPAFNAAAVKDTPAPAHMQMGHRISPMPTAPDPRARQAASSSAAKSSLVWRDSAEIGNKSSQSVLDALISADPSTAERVGYTPRPLPPSGTEPDQDKKRWCTYWIRTGECDYTQQGCLYKHEMPDRATLTKIGFRSVPKWFEDRNNQVNRLIPTIKRKDPVEAQPSRSNTAQATGSQGKFGPAHLHHTNPAVSHITENSTAGGMTDDDSSDGSESSSSADLKAVQVRPQPTPRRISPRNSGLPLNITPRNPARRIKAAANATTRKQGAAAPHHRPGRANAANVTGTAKTLDAYAPLVPTQRASAPTTVTPQGHKEHNLSATQQAASSKLHDPSSTSAASDQYTSLLDTPAGLTAPHHRAGRFIPNAHSNTNDRVQAGVRIALANYNSKFTSNSTAGGPQNEATHTNETQPLTLAAVLTPPPTTASTNGTNLNGQANGLENSQHATTRGDS